MTLLVPLPWWAIAVGAAICVWIARRTYADAPIGAARREALAALRTVTLLLLAAFLLRPAIVRPLPRATGVVPVLVDASRSMAIRDGAGEAGAGEAARSRFEQAVAVAQGPLARALAGYRLEWLELRDLVQPLDAARAPNGASSDLSGAIAAVRDRYRDRPVPGIILLSDGVDTGDLMASSSAPDPAVFPIGIGSATPARDQEVLSVELDPEALPGSAVDLTATVVTHGYAREPVDVRLLAGGRPIDLRRITPAADGLPTRVVFELPPAGEDPLVYTVDLPGKAGEATLDNNARHAMVQPIGRKRRLLFVQGAPGYDHGFLARAWAADPLLDVDIVVRKGHNDAGAPTFYVQAAADRAPSLAAGLPADRAMLFAYDALVLGNATRDLFTDSAIDLLDAFVAERGGGVLVLGARSFASGGLAAGDLGSLLPVGPRRGSVDAARASLRGPGDLRLALTDVGARHGVLRLGSSREESARQWAAAPPLAGVAPLGPLRPGAVVLAVGAGAPGAPPVIAVQRYGEGRALVFAGEASWRWKMQRPLRDTLYDTFWRQAARWVSAPSPDPVALDVDADAGPGVASTVGVTVRDERFEPIRDAAVEIAVSDERGKVLEVLRASLTNPDRGRYTATWRAPSAGLFRFAASARRAGARLPSADRVVFAGSADAELRDPRRQDAVLARIAERTGGRLIDPSSVSELPGLLHARAQGLPSVARREIWHGPWTFGLIVLLLSVEWGFRRRWGLR